MIAARHAVAFGDPRLPERFWSKCMPEPNSGCWLWLARVNSLGYGSLNINRRARFAHRLAFEALVGPIADGLVIDHRCRVSSCVNPAHLEPVSNRENVRRGLKGELTTHCPAGHPYDDSNTYLNVTSFGSVRRQCRTCQRLRTAEKRRENREYFREYQRAYRKRMREFDSCEPSSREIG